MSIHIIFISHVNMTFIPSHPWILNMVSERYRVDDEDEGSSTDSDFDINVDGGSFHDQENEFQFSKS